MYLSPSVETVRPTPGRGPRAYCTVVDSGRPASVVGAATSATGTISARRRLGGGRRAGRLVLGRRARRGEGVERALEGEHRLVRVRVRVRVGLGLGLGLG